MGKEYAKVLKARGLNFTVVGRSQKSVDSFNSEMGLNAVSGGIEQWLKTGITTPKAIVAVTEDMLGKVALALIKYGVKDILIEKPGGFDGKEIAKVAKEAKRKKINIYIGYNRRFYSSALKAAEIIKDEGILSFNFDFTERSYVVEKLPQSDRIKKNWFLHNSTHVIDMAFFMCGWPKEIKTHRKGKLKWHPAGSIYAGTGISDKNAVFSYHANWSSAGRWGVEVMTPKSKLIFRPLEKLQIQKYGSMSIEDVPLDDKLDIDYKPGLYRQVESFLKNKKGLPTIGEQMLHIKTYIKINGHI